MGRKRKSNPAAAPAQNFQSAFEDRKGSRMTLASWEDAIDSEDEFLAGKEKVLLEEGPDRKRLRNFREEEAQLGPSDEEILDVSSNDEESEDDENEYNEVDVQGDTIEDFDEDVQINGLQKRIEEDALEGWGSSRRDLYGDDELETEADALAHEVEARRIQMKQLAEMNDDDFGFADAEWTVITETTGGARDIDATEDHILEILPEATLADDASAEERLKLLRQRYPEFEPLKQEFVSLQGSFVELRQVYEEQQAQSLKKTSRQACRMQVLEIQYQALSAYLGTLAMYFALLTSTADSNSGSLAKAPTELRDHDVMEGLVRTRTTWLLAKDLKVSLETEENGIESTTAIEAEVIKPPKSTVKQKIKKVDTTEVARLASDARRAARLAAVEEDFADLEKLADTKSPEKLISQSLRNDNNDADSDLGDDTEMNAFEAAAKAAKRKSLRFYTSQITQKTMKRSAKGREVGGDTDIPYREKWKQRQARLQEEASRRSDKAGARDNVKNGVTNDGHGSDSDAYQNLLERATKHKADKKKAAADAYDKREAAKQAAFYDEAEVMGLDGKRKINYQIEKNKGLAPHRKKEVRNPRVKKRKKFDQQKKRLGSTKALYKGGPGKGGYQGEMTGIKANLVKGIKLS